MPCTGSSALYGVNRNLKKTLLQKTCKYFYFSRELHLFTIFVIYWTKLPSQIVFWRSNYKDSEIF